MRSVLKGSVGIKPTLIRPMSKVVVRPSTGPKTGVDAMFWAAHWFESTVCLEVALIGREADDLTNDAVLELTGRWLSYRIALRGGWVWLTDAGEEWEKVFNVGDCSQGWTTMKSFVFALERSGIKSLERPLVVGTLASPNSWVIA